MGREEWVIGLEILVKNWMAQALTFGVPVPVPQTSGKVVKNYVISPDPYQL